VGLGRWADCSRRLWSVSDRPCDPLCLFLAHPDDAGPLPDPSLEEPDVFWRGERRGTGLPKGPRPGRGTTRTSRDAFTIFPVCLNVSEVGQAEAHHS
jgi:hypothetical protein